MTPHFIILSSMFFGTFFLHLWMRTDPKENFLPFWIVKLRYLKAKKNSLSKKLTSADFPQIKLSDLELHTRILVSDLTQEGDLICRKVFGNEQDIFFALQDYECTEPFKILDKIYEVRNAFGLKQLEYCKERLTHEVEPSVGIYTNLKNIPIIRARAAA